MHEVRLWHFSDLSGEADNVRSQEQSGLLGFKRRSPSLTPEAAFIAKLFCASWYKNYDFS
jgi:hypothetical protein